jgi:hypothetical protein
MIVEKVLKDMLEDNLDKAERLDYNHEVFESLQLLELEYCSFFFSKLLVFFDVHKKNRKK